MNDRRRSRGRYVFRPHPGWQTGRSDGDAIRTGDLDIVLPAYQPSEINIYAVYASRKHLSAKVRVFIDFAIDQIGEQPAWDAEI